MRLVLAPKVVVVVAEVEAEAEEDEAEVVGGAFNKRRSDTIEP